MASTSIWGPAEVIGQALFAFGSVGTWANDAVGMGIPLVLHGLRFEGLYPMPPVVTAAQRVAWLDRDPDGYSPQPYSQLASVYRAARQDLAAQLVLIASQARRRRQVSG